MEELMTYLLSPVAQIALIVGIAEMLKRLGIKTKYIPLFDLLLGVISGICVYHFTMDYGIAQSIVLGIAMGLSACGLFSGIKNTFEQRADTLDYLEDEDD